jgi:hypothetical protein
MSIRQPGQSMLEARPDRPQLVRSSVLPRNLPDPICRLLFPCACAKMPTLRAASQSRPHT